MKNKKSEILPRLSLANSQGASVHLPLEFEGKRAFAVWDCYRVGKLELKARIEVNPKLLKPGRDKQYSYQGTIVLPRPGDN